MPISTIRAIWLNTVQIHNQLQRGVIRVIIYTFCHEILLYNSFICTFTQIRELKLFTFSTIPLIYLTIANMLKLRPPKKLRDSRLRDKNSIVVVFLTFREKSKNLDTIQAVIQRRRGHDSTKSEQEVNLRIQLIKIYSTHQIHSSSCL